MKSVKSLKRSWHRQCKEHCLFCYLCGQLILKESEISADHVIPQSMGGPTNEFNLKPTHIKCNNIRDTMSISDFQWVLNHIFKGNVNDWWELLHQQHLLKQRH